MPRGQSKKELDLVPRAYQTYIKSGQTDEKSDHRQLLRVDDYLKFAGTDIENHDHETVESFIQHCKVERENSARYVQQQFWFIRKFYEWHVPKTISENPCDHVDTVHYFGKGIPKSKKDALTPDGEDTIYYFEADGVKELIRHAPPNPVSRNRLLIKLMYVTGPRAKEARLLKWDDIHWDEKTVKYITAKQRGETETRHVPYPETLPRYLRSWREKQRAKLGGEDAKFIFTGDERDENGFLKPISTERVNEIVKEAAENAGLQKTLYEDSNGRERKMYTSHSLRHSYAVFFITGGDPKGNHGRSGGDIRTLKYLLGHHSTSITERYLRFKKQTKIDIGRRYGPR